MSDDPDFRMKGSDVTNGGVEKYEANSIVSESNPLQLEKPGHE